MSSYVLAYTGGSMPASEAEPDGEETLVPAVPGRPYRFAVGAPRFVAPGALRHARDFLALYE